MYKYTLNLKTENVNKKETVRNHGTAEQFHDCGRMSPDRPVAWQHIEQDDQHAGHDQIARPKRDMSCYGIDC